MTNNDLLRRTILDLHEVGAVKFGEFRLKLHEKNPDAPLSPVYIDLRLVRSYPFLLRDVTALLGRTVVALQPDYVADVPTAATPIVGCISATFDIPMVTPRMDQKDYGTRAPIDGHVRVGAKVVVVDDLITKAHSKLAAIERLENSGLVVKDVVVLVDRGQGGKEELSGKGYTLHSVVTLQSMLDLYVETSRLTEEEAQKVIDYLRNS